MRKHQCSLNEKCLTNNVVYKASITPNERNSKTKVYYGVSETVFKLYDSNYTVFYRYANHKKTFNNIKLQADTEKVCIFDCNLVEFFRSLVRIFPYWD